MSSLLPEVVMNREDRMPVARIVLLVLEQQFISNNETRALLLLLVLEQQFISNNETRVLLLNAKFHTFIQGDLSMMTTTINSRQ